MERGRVTVLSTWGRLRACAKRLVVLLLLEERLAAQSLASSLTRLRATWRLGRGALMWRQIIIPFFISFGCVCLAYFLFSNRERIAFISSKVCLLSLPSK
jgi:hypothetical protein